MLKFVTRKFEISKSLIRNKFRGQVLVEKINKKRGLFTFVTLSSGATDIPLMTVNTNYRTVLNTGSNVVGGYDLTGGNKGFLITFVKKPNFFRRTMINFFFGWKWFNNDEL